MPKFHGSVVKTPYIKSSNKIGFKSCGFYTTNTKVNISFSYRWLNYSDIKTVKICAAVLLKTFMIK